MVWRGLTAFGIVSLYFFEVDGKIVSVNIEQYQKILKEII